MAEASSDWSSRAGPVIQFWDTASRALLATREVADRVRILFPPDGGHCVTTTLADGEVLAWDTGNLGDGPRVLAGPLPRPQARHQEAAFSPDGRLLAVTEQASLRLWNRN